MAQVRPFTATRYNPNAVESLADVVAPPYDVISPEFQEELHRREAHNIVRLILGKDGSEDDEYRNKYQRAASLIKEWKNSGVLIDDPEPAFYIYQQEFETPDGRTNVRTGFFGAVKLESLEEGGIHAHEHTFEGPKADRLKLLRSTKCNLSPIFLLYSDPDHVTDRVLEKAMACEGKPRAEVTDGDGVIHRLWVVSKPEQVDALSHLMDGRDLFIADGHHRYETSVRYMEESHADGKSPAAYTMGFLCNMDSPGMRVLPTHRVLSSELGEDVEIGEVVEDLEEFFDLEEVKVNLRKPEAEAAKLLSKLAKQGADAPSFAMVLPTGQAFVIHLRDAEGLVAEMAEDMDEAIARLDVSILHQYLIPRVWVGNPEVELDDQDVFYVKDAGDALKMLSAKPFASAVFLMQATRIEQVREIASRNLRMPHKSTYFYPKLITGLVLRDHSTCTSKA